MKKSHLTLLLILLSHFSFSQPCNLKEVAKHAHNKTITEIITYLSLDSTNYYAFQEPFGIVRGIRGSKNGMDFLFYVERTSQPLDIDTTGGNWIVLPQKSNLSLILEEKIIGFSIRCGDDVITKGETIPYYNFDWRKE